MICDALAPNIQMYKPGVWKYAEIYHFVLTRSSIWKPERWEAHGMLAFEQHEIHTLAELNARHSSKGGKCAAGNIGVPRK